MLAWLAVRALGLPIWWVAFPPIVDAALVGNPDVAVLAFLVCAGGRLGPVAPFLKIYALIPMLGERRWRQVAISCGLLAASLLVLPWGLWWSQTAGHHRPPHLGLGEHVGLRSADPHGDRVVALLSLGLRRAGWLAVPILWPYTQFHYAASRSRA